MKRFARLFRELDETTRTNEKVDALVRYFESTPPADAAWALAFLSGRRIQRAVNARLLFEWAVEESEVARARARGGRRARGDGAPRVGRLRAERRRVPRARRGGRYGGGPAPAVSLLPRLPARRRPLGARLPRAVAGKMEMGRHPRSAPQARRRDPRLARRRAASLRRAAAPHRPQESRPEDPPRRPGGVPRVRPPRGLGRGPARAAARRAARPARVPRSGDVARRGAPLSGRRRDDLGRPRPRAGASAGSRG